MPETRLERSVRNGKRWNNPSLGYVTAQVAFPVTINDPPNSYVNYTADWQDEGKAATNYTVRVKKEDMPTDLSLVNQSTNPVVTYALWDGL